MSNGPHFVKFLVAGHKVDTSNSNAALFNFYVYYGSLEGCDAQMVGAEWQISLDFSYAKNNSANPTKTIILGV